MYHFFAKNDNVSEEHILIVGEDVNHIKNVLRMKNGEEVIISDEDGNDYNCEIDTLDDEAVKMKIRFRYATGHELPSKIYLFQGLPKNDKMELIIQKCVELGVYEVIPVATKRAIVKLDKKKEESKIKRWQSISESAAKQSKRSVIPEIKSVMNLKEAFEYGKDIDILLMPYENAKGMAETRRIINEIKPGMSVGIFIGPEGGFDESEVEFALEKNALPITLGKRILRTETAGMTVMSVLMYNLEE